MRAHLAAAAAGAFATAAAFALGQMSPAQAAPLSAVRASAFVLVDAEGRERAELSTLAAQKSVQLILKDRSGRMRAILGVDKDENPALALLDAGGMIRVQAGISPYDSASVSVLVDRTGRRVDVSAGHDGMLSLVCFDAQNRAGVVLALGRDGQPALRLVGADGGVLTALPEPTGPAPGVREGGVRDGVTGENLGADPLDRMENPLTSPKRHEKLTGVARTNAALFFARWSGAYAEAVRARAMWQALLASGGADLRPMQEAIQNALKTYLAQAASAEASRGEYYGVVGKDR